MNHRFEKRSQSESFKFIYQRFHSLSACWKFSSGHHKISKAKWNKTKSVKFDSNECISCFFLIWCNGFLKMGLVSWRWISFKCDSIHQIEATTLCVTTTLQGNLVMPFRMYTLSRKQCSHLSKGGTGAGDAVGTVNRYQNNNHCIFTLGSPFVQLLGNSSEQLPPTPLEVFNSSWLFHGPLFSRKFSPSPSTSSIGFLFWNFPHRFVRF